MDALWELARKHNLAVVEDAAHAVGTHYRGEHLGSASSSLSDAVAYSFYATKNITTGEGGMVTTNQHRAGGAHAHAGAARHQQGRLEPLRAKSGNWYYEVLEPGFKYNLSDMQSALGIHQLRKLERFIARRAALAAASYDTARRHGGAGDCPPDCDYGRHAWHLYILRLNPNG